MSRIWIALQKFFAHYFGYDIFISYRRADGTKYAKALQQELAKQFVVFRDETDLDYGEEFPTLLKQRISRCRVLIVIVTPKALEEDSWVLKEIEMRLDATNKKTFGLFPRKPRIIPIYFDGINPQQIQGNSAAHVALRESNGEQVNETTWAPSDTCENVSRAFGTLQLRKRIVLGAWASIVGLLSALVAILISASAPYYWEQLPAPLAKSQYEEEWLQPIEDIAVSRSNPNHILYLGAVSEYDDKTDSGELVPTLISSIGEHQVKVDGVDISKLDNLEEILKRLTEDNNWATTAEYSEATNSEYWDLPLDWGINRDSAAEQASILSSKLQDEFSSASNPEQLADLLSTLYWGSGDVKVEYSSLSPQGWSLEVFTYHWQEPIQGHGMGNDESTEMAVRFGQNDAWTLVYIDNVIGIWPLGTSADAALVLTSDEGFFWTHDSGNNWEPANFGEKGFENGVRVKPVVVGEGIFAYIDWRSKNNPLFRLKKRGLFEMFLDGAIKILGNSNGQDNL